MNIAEMAEKILEMKKAEGRDYYFMQKTEKETYYLDDNSNVLVIHPRKCDGITYFLEIEETKGEKDMCQFSIYESDGFVTLKKILGVFDEEGSNGNKAQAAELFHRFRDAEDIKVELERYAKEKL